MSDERRASTCDEFADNLAELALGILTGRDRVATLAHVESCPRCADELEQLARAADAALQLAPDVEPPVGFETRLFSRMGVATAPTRRRAVPPRWVLATAAAVIALIAGVSIGWVTKGTPVGHTQATQQQAAPAGTPVAAADLMENGVPVGHVFAYGGAKPWMFMTLADSSAQGKVTCVVVTADGVTHTVGTFTVDQGYGSWGAALHVAPTDIRRAEVLAPNGAVIATAPLG
jgi:hypothetical protein